MLHYLYYKPNNSHEDNLERLTDKIYKDWKDETKQPTDINKEIENYTRYNMIGLYLGELLELCHETLGNSHDSQDKGPMSCLLYTSDSADE